MAALLAPLTVRPRRVTPIHAPSTVVWATGRGGRDAVPRAVAVARHVRVKSSPSLNMEARPVPPAQNHNSVIHTLVVKIALWEDGMPFLAVRGHVVTGNSKWRAVFKCNRLEAALRALSSPVKRKHNGNRVGPEDRARVIANTPRRGACVMPAAGMDNGGYALMSVNNPSREVLDVPSRVWSTATMVRVLAVHGPSPPIHATIMIWCGCKKRAIVRVAIQLVRHGVRTCATSMDKLPTDLFS